MRLCFYINFQACLCNAHHDCCDLKLRRHENAFFLSIVVIKKESQQCSSNTILQQMYRKGKNWSPFITQTLVSPPTYNLLQKNFSHLLSQGKFCCKYFPCTHTVVFILRFTQNTSRYQCVFDCFCSWVKLTVFRVFSFSLLNYV